MRALFLALPLLCLACSSAPLSGAERWEKVEDLDPDDPYEWAPTIESNKGVYNPGQRVELTITAPSPHFLYVLLMLPNNDVYLLAPSPRIPDHRAARLEISPSASDFEIFAPRLEGEARILAIASEQELSLLSEGWIRAGGSFEFDTWPRTLPLDEALTFIAESLDEKPWSFATSSFTIQQAPVGG